ncbi:thiolase family protein [Propylenella binzhouense]|uniref:Thiolase family protein n=1 Tax=Propylenella binzhouense TaxID=2555902 RepID=A0A964T1T3_9HYPH|nr:thiolase family protein [Propylenella binzhouense]MYZ46886.1 thiolase family protein [Propylenella binzhouense]
MSLKGKGAVTGIGETDYMRASPKDAFELQIEASLKAIADAGLSPRDIDGIIPIGITGAPAEAFVTNFGIPDLRFSAITPLGGASGIAALQAAVAAISAGICNHVLIPSGRNVSSGARAGVRIHQMPQFHLVTEFEYPLGAISPAQLYAPMARRHMELYGTTSRQFAEVAIAMREHAILHGNAVMKKPITVEDHQNSRMITDPFRLLDCSLESDGGAALVVSAAERARDMRQPVVEILGVAEGHPDSPSSITQRPDITRLGIAKAAPKAFGMAGVTPEDIQVAEIYDCFTYIVICQLEDMGFCKKGEGGAFVEGGRLRLGGALPTNTHGGLLSQAHMLGMNHIVELVRQLRGQGGRTQVADARLGLATGYGDLGDGALTIMARA